MDRLRYYLCLFVMAFIPLEAVTISDDLEISYGRIAYIFLLLLALFKPSLFIPSKKSFIVVLTVFTVYCWISIIWSSYPGVTFFVCLKLVQYLSIVILFHNLIKTPNQILGLFTSYLIGAFYIIIKTIVDFFTIGRAFLESSSVYRTEAFGNPNENAFMIIFGIIIIFLISRHSSNRIINNFISPLYIALATVAILCTGSRSGFIMLLIFILAYSWIKIRKFSIISILKIGLVTLILFAVLIDYFPTESIVRLLTISDSLKNMELSHRETIWSNALKMINSSDHNILLGSGWGTFQDNYKHSFRIYYGSHNFYLNILYTTGLIGCAIVVTYLITLFNRLREINDKDKIIYFLLLIVPMISMLTTNWESRKWWFILGIIISLFRDLNKILVTENNENKD
jgi:O-antigen ligase